MYRIAICDDDLVFGSLLEQYLQNFAKTHRIPIDVLVFARGEEYLEFLIEEFRGRFKYCSWKPFG